jgi:predicted HicB family RNase H-like nuclease
MSRVTLRIPASLKATVDAAAAAKGLSLNAWITRCLEARAEREEAKSKQ